MPRSCLFLAPALAALLLAACAAPAPAPAPVAPPPPPAPTPAPPPVAACDAAGAQFAVGQMLTPPLESAVRTRAGAAVVRVLKPGQAVTMEFNVARVNIEVDARNRVKAVRCG